MCEDTFESVALRDYVLPVFLQCSGKKKRTIYCIESWDTKSIGQSCNHLRQLPIYYTWIKWNV